MTDKELTQIINGFNNVVVMLQRIEIKLNKLESIAYNTGALLNNGIVVSKLEEIKKALKAQ